MKLRILFIQIGFFCEAGMSKLDIQRLFTPAGLKYKDVWVGNDWPSPAKGPLHWARYCAKELALPTVNIGTRITDEEYAEWHKDKPVKVQGKRTDLGLIKEKLDNGEDINDIVCDSVEAFTAGSKNMAFFAAYQGLKRKRTEFMKPTVECYYGETGTGKTRKAYEDLGYDLSVTWRWTPGRGSTFFDGYTGQDNVIFDEFRGQLALGQMLSLLDGYPDMVQIKGGSVHWSPTRIILTSPSHPRDWYVSVGPDKIDQLLRRIDKITQFHKDL